MRTIKWLAVAVVVVVVVLLGTASLLGNSDRGTSVSTYMESTGTTGSVTVSDVYDQPVSDVVIVCAYTPERAITRELGFDWSGAESLYESLSADDSYQGVIAVHEGDVVEYEVITFADVDLCDMDLRYPATLGAETTLRISPSSQVLTDGTTYPVASLG